MKSSDNSQKSEANLSRRGALFEKSAVLSFLDRLCSGIYNFLKNGFFAGIFSSYPEDKKTYVQNKYGSSRFKKSISGFRRKTAVKIETSRVIESVNSMASSFLSCKLKVIGIFLFAFGAYTGIFSLITGLLSETGYIPRACYGTMLTAAVILLCSIPLLSARKTLSLALNSSAICKKIIPALGLSLDKLKRSGETGSSLAAFVLGLVAGAATYAVDPIIIIGAILAVIMCYVIMAKPEFGLMCLFFFMPFWPTMALAGITIIVAFSYFIKAIRGKRIIKIELLDIFVIIFAGLLFFGGTVSLSTKSIAPSLMFICLLLGYFLTACFNHSREWLVRFTNAAIISALIVALYGIFLYVIGSSAGGAWLDTELFSDIAGRAVSTLENPNMLGEYLVMIIPMAMATIISGEAMKRSTAFTFFVVLAFCLVITWSRGAWLGLIFATIILLFMWHRRSMWIVVGGILALPLASFVMPASIANRFLSIGNVADTSTSYRVNIWRGAMRMIRDHLFYGLGVGEGAWREVYPDYSLPGIEDAPHAHNLYMQTAVEMGIFALIVLLIVLFLLYQSGFSFFSKLSKSDNLSASIFSRSDKSDSDLTINDYLDVDREKKRGVAKLKLRMAVAGPLCGIFGVLVQGFTEYAWYNYRVYLMFWLVIGLASAYVRDGRKAIKDTAREDLSDDGTCADVDLQIKS